MSKFVIKRILVMIPVLLGVTLLIFTMMYFTDGNPARLILGASRKAYSSWCSRR